MFLGARVYISFRLIEYCRGGGVLLYKFILLSKEGKNECRSGNGCLKLVSNKTPLEEF